MCMGLYMYESLVDLREKFCLGQLCQQRREDLCHSVRPQRKVIVEDAVTPLKRARVQEPRMRRQLQLFCLACRALARRMLRLKEFALETLQSP